MFAKADSPLPLESQYLESLSEQDVATIIFDYFRYEEWTVRLTG